MAKDAKYSVLAFVSGMVVFALLILLELEGVDWAGVYRKWFGLTVSEMRQPTVFNTHYGILILFTLVCKPVIRIG